MKVWIVLEGIDYEGTIPIAVFYSEMEATLYARGIGLKTNDEHHDTYLPDYVAILECVIGVPVKDGFAQMHIVTERGELRN